MKSIDNPDEIKFYRMGGASLRIIVSPYKNEMPEDILFIPEWRETEEDEILNFQDIYEQIKEKYGESLILVIAEYPLSGYIYRYGNYFDKKWMQVGKMDGYA